MIEIRRIIEYEPPNTYNKLVNTIQRELIKRQKEFNTRHSKSLDYTEDIKDDLSNYMNNIDTITLQMKKGKGKVYLNDGKNKSLKFEKIISPGPGQYNVSSSVILQLTLV